jgi:DNA-binding transcriptional MerR regulator
MFNLDSNQSHFAKKFLTSGEIGRLTGVSYRQINDWHSRGAIHPDQTSPAGWRRFSVSDAFYICVLAELKDKFSVALPKDGQLYLTLTGNDRQVLDQIYSAASKDGVETWLETDLASYYRLSTDRQDVNTFRYGGRRSSNSNLRVNLTSIALVLARTIKTLWNDQLLDESSDVQADLANLVKQLQNLNPTNLGGQQLAPHTVSVHSGGEESATVRTQANRSTDSDLQSLVAEHPFQTITINVRGGRINTINQEVITKI